ncbi:hypothetical protein [Actinoplanes sp. NPDC026623]|uniref:hypothetical protein n=1 Tax=Actinoplanes sp. NPDC026623 TaxID=3155610 RepID=UPI003400D025
MGASNGPTSRLDAEQRRSIRLSPNRPQVGVYVSRSAAANGLPRIRELARAGGLAEAAGRAQGADRARLSGAVYEVAWPIVFTRLTRRLELSRGHAACASAVERLAPDCLDRFHDDVESVVQDTLAHARNQVHDLEGWIASRLTAATVDGHRRMRGSRGALQRPRLPTWVADGLRHDAWLTSLAVEILVWVGVGATAGAELWPLESWSHQRGLRTGDWAGSDPGVVAREVEQVLAVMRRRPGWYESYVERPLGAKPAPVATAPIGEVTGATATPLPLGDPDERIDGELLRLAGEAVRVIDGRMTRGEKPEDIVVEVIRAVFGGTFTGTLDRAPHSVADPLGGVTGALTNPGRLDRIVDTVLSILGRERAGQGSHATP